MIRTLLLLLLLHITLLGVGCLSSEPSKTLHQCVDGATQVCSCEAGMEGIQSCLILDNGGSAWSECQNCVEVDTMPDILQDDSTDDTGTEDPDTSEEILEEITEDTYPDTVEDPIEDTASEIDDTEPELEEIDEIEDEVEDEIEEEIEEIEDEIEIEEEIEEIEDEIEEEIEEIEDEIDIEEIEEEIDEIEDEVEEIEDIEEEIEEIEEVEEEIEEGCSTIAEIRATPDGETDLTLCHVYVTYAFGFGYFLQSSQQGPGIRVYEGNGWEPDVRVGDLITIRVTEMTTWRDNREIVAHDDVIVETWGHNINPLVQRLTVAPGEDFADEIVLVSGALIDNISSRNVTISYGDVFNVVLRVSDDESLCVGEVMDILAVVTVFDGQWRVESMDPVDFFNINRSGCESIGRSPHPGELIINEFLADVPDSFPGSLNCTGFTGNSLTEEYIEIVNVTEDILSMAEVTISDSEGLRYTFDQTVYISPRGAILLTGGVDPECRWDLWEIQDAYLVQATNGLGLDDDGDSIYVRDKNNVPIITVNYGSEASGNVAMTLNPDLNDTNPDPVIVDGFVRHSLADTLDDSGFSPGTGICGFFEISCDRVAEGPEPGDLLINEFLADINGWELDGDANCDGVIDGSFSEDEFVELVNISNRELYMGGVFIHDETRVRHAFGHDITMSPGEVILVFGGGLPRCNSWPSDMQVFTASVGALGFNNSGDTITVKSTTGDLLLEIPFGEEAGSDQSLTLSPDLNDTDPDGWRIGGFELHGEATGADGRTFSPGTRIDGSHF